MYDLLHLLNVVNVVNFLAHVAYLNVSQTLFLLTNFLTALQMFNDVIFLFQRRFTIRCRASIHLSWCIKRNWAQSSLGYMTFRSFMLVPVCRSRKCFFTIYTSTWNNHLATSKNNQHWFAKSNGWKRERQINAIKEYLYSRLQCNVIQFESLQGKRREGGCISDIHRNQTR